MLVFWVCFACVSGVLGLCIELRFKHCLVCGACELQACRALFQAGSLRCGDQVWRLYGRSHGDEDAFSGFLVTWDVHKALLLRWQPTSDTLHAKPH
jgi:hypothetical protein